MPISPDHPIMDVANDNNPMRTSFEVPIAIPGSKDRARQEIAAAMNDDALAITHCPYKPPRSPAAYKPPKRAANDNEPLAWPLLEELRRDGRESDIGVVRRYRQLCAVVGANPYDVDAGNAVVDIGVAVEYRTLRLKGVEQVDAAAKLQFPGQKVAGGSLSYREARQSTRHRVDCGRRSVTTETDAGMPERQASLRVHLAEGDRIAQIDGRPILAEIRTALDVDPFEDGVPILDVFEDAALGGMTLTYIGGTLMFKHKARSREAKQRVYTGIDIVRDEWRHIEHRETVMAAQCHQRVLARRAELEAQQMAFLGLAA